MAKDCLLIIDDEQDMRNGLKRMLARNFDELDILTAADAESGLLQIEEFSVDLLLLDIKMPGMSGLELLEKLSTTAPWLTVIMMTGFGSIETAVEAIKLGAYDFISKPFNKEAICRIIRKGIERKRLIQENYFLKQKVGDLAGLTDFIGQSEPMRNFLSQLRTIARSNYTTLVRGESGTGKELTARALHNLSARRDMPLIMVNCPAIPEHLLESELFGHVRGAFTGANHDQTGLFAEADGGTICLDEIGDIPITVQSKLLRVLQEQEIKPLGASKTKKIDVRVTALTNLDLEQMIRQRKFREDLFYRLNVVSLRTPSLSEIIDDIPLLVNHFTSQVCHELDLPEKRFNQQALNVLMQRSWPGNVRELQNVVRRAVMFCMSTVIRVADLQIMDIPVRKNVNDSEDYGLNDGKEIIEYKVAKEQVVDDFTVNYVMRLLKETGGNVSQAAEISGLTRTALQKIMRRRNITAAEYRSKAE
ncbi:MAG: sigma-54-dependent Fis family transcriptional regulator [Desulfobulbaceae bacterium]|nr:sigma-54-dependent Fis family transcriptional regulator [Desulfobulbaceae bacterium]